MGYVGEFVDNLAEGYGKFISHDGNLNYEGYFEKNLPHGKGIKVTNGKERYEGDFTRGKKEDTKGKQSVEGKYTYEGGFKNDLYDGEGVYKYEDGTLRSYNGQWCDGVFSGRGTYIFQNCDVYEGEYLGGLKHGQGKLVMADKGIIMKENGLLVNKMAKENFTQSKT